jgi:hypothetical protein
MTEATQMFVYFRVGDKGLKGAPGHILKPNTSDGAPHENSGARL